MSNLFFKSITAALLIFSANAARAADYAITIIDDPKGSHFLEARGLNNLGEVVGVSIDKSGKPNAPRWHGFYFHDKKYNMPPIPAGCELSETLAINDRHEIVGFAQPKNGVQKAYIWRGARVSELSENAVGASAAVSINNAGVAVGWITLNDGKTAAAKWPHPFSSKKAEIIFGQNKAIAIADNGDCVATQGYDTFLVHPTGAPVPIGTLGGKDAVGTALNTRGAVTGISDTADALSHAFLWSGGAMQDLSQIRPADKTEPAINIYSINDSGIMVGTVRNGLDSLAMVFKNGRPYNLNHLVDRTGAYQGLVLDVARAINNKGQIIGQAHIKGHYISFLLTPTPAKK